MVGADLANVVHEAALTAARRDREAVTMADLHDALERLVLGTERRILLRAADRRRTAYHEAGHAIIGMLTPGPTQFARCPSSRAASPSGSRYRRRRPTGPATTAATCWESSASRWAAGWPKSSSSRTSPPAPRNDIKLATELARNMVGL